MRGSIETGHPADLGLQSAFRAKLAQTGRLGRFRKFAAVRIEDKTVVVVLGLGQPE